MWEIVLVNAGQCGVLSLRAMLRCGRVSRRWREAVLAALPTLRAVDFRGCETRITGPDVLAVLARVAGKNLAAVDLARCRRLGAADMEQILACVAATCPRVAAIDVTGCRARSVIRAVAVRARDALAAASPLDLYVLLEALRRAGEEDDEECVVKDPLSCLEVFPNYSEGYPAQPRTRVRASVHLPVQKCTVNSGTDW